MVRSAGTSGGPSKKKKRPLPARSNAASSLEESRQRCKVSTFGSSGLRTNSGLCRGLKSLHLECLPGPLPPDLRSPRSSGQRLWSNCWWRQIPPSSSTPLQADMVLQSVLHTTSAKCTNGWRTCATWGALLCYRAPSTEITRHFTTCHIRVDDGNTFMSSSLNFRVNFGVLGMGCLIRSRSRLRLDFA